MITDNNTTAVTFIRRSNTADKDLFLGCLKSVLVVEYAGGRFSKLLFVPNYHAGIVVDMCIYEQFLLTVSKGDEHIGVLEFEQPI